jgi:hypothetical protein
VSILLCESFDFRALLAAAAEESETTAATAALSERSPDDTLN